MSLVDFDPTKRTDITTPKSKKALAQLGLTVSDLYYPTREEIQAQEMQLQFKDDTEFYIELKLKHIRERVDRFLHELRRERENLDECGSNDQHGNLSHLQQSQSFMQKQQQILRTLQNKQSIEIEREIQYELRLEQIRKKNEYKQQRLKEIKLQQEQEFEKRMQEKEQKLHLREQKLQQARLNADQQNEKIMQKLQEEEIKIRMKQEKYAKMKLEEKIRRDQLFQEKMDRRQMKLKRQEEEIQLENKQRQSEYHKKLQMHEDNLKEKQNNLKLKNQWQEEKAKQKYMNATLTKFNEIKRIEERMNSKERDVQIRTALMEQQRQETFEKRRQQEYQKQQQMESRKQQIEYQTQQKHQNYFNQQLQREIKKQQADIKLKEERSEMSMINQSRLDEAQMKLRQMQFQNEIDNQRFLQNKMNNIMNAEENRYKYLQNIKRKYIIELLKLEDAQQNYQIQKRKDDYKNQLMIEKFEEVEKRQRLQKLEAERLQESKRQMEANLEKQQLKILAEFDQKKQQYLEKQTNQQQNKSSSQVKPSTERIVNKNQKTNSMTSFHLPPANQSIVEPKSEKNSKFVAESRQSVVLKKESKSQTSNYRSQKPKQYFISQQTLQAISLYANNDTLKKMHIEVRPKRKKTTPK